jgi:hypothetical protein
VQLKRVPLDSQPGYLSENPLAKLGLALGISLQIAPPQLIEASAKVGRQSSVVNAGRIARGELVNRRQRDRGFHQGDEAYQRQRAKLAPRA